MLYKNVSVEKAKQLVQNLKKKLQLKIILIKIKNFAILHYINIQKKSKVRKEFYKGHITKNFMAY